MTDTVPTPTELFDSPELAILAALSTTLRAVESTLLSLNPEIASLDEHLRQPALPGASAVVWTLLTLARALSDQIDFYRELVAERAPTSEELAENL